MSNLQWLAMPAVAAVAVIATLYFGVRNLRDGMMQREREAGYADGRVNAKLENLEQLLRGHDAKLAEVRDELAKKLEAHGRLLGAVRDETKKLRKQVRKLAKRVAALESGTPPPTGAPASVASIENHRRSS